MNSIQEIHTYRLDVWLILADFLFRLFKSGRRFGSRDHRGWHYSLFLHILVELLCRKLPFKHSHFNPAHILKTNFFIRINYQGISRIKGRNIVNSFGSKSGTIEVLDDFFSPKHFVLFENFSKCENFLICCRTCKKSPKTKYWKT